MRSAGCGDPAANGKAKDGYEVVRIEGLATDVINADRLYD
jgi:hypothetical protein